MLRAAPPVRLSVPPLIVPLTRVHEPLVASSVLLGGMNVWLEMWHTRPLIVDGQQMLAAAAISLPYVFVSRAIFPGAENQQERSLEEHYLKHRHLILIMLAIPTIVSVATHMLLDGVRYYGWEAWWAAARIAAPLALLPFAHPRIQRSGLVALNLLQLVGLFR